ncbi:tyrosine integrase [Arthrobacter phage Melons]|uniref:Integrase n=1 Tax=Arthrobacter phage Melons TaxID=2419962 RepID=A0A3G2KHX5_9CAUD|nr:tyrosine integrase [Arthrobacter phage Melons]
MGRPPLPVGTWGAVRVEKIAGGYRARARFRDFDGRTRDVERSGKTKGAARAALTADLNDRTAPAGEEITASTRLQLVAEIWRAEKWPNLAENSRKRYRDALEDHILPGLGALTVSECSVTRIDRFLKATAAGTGAPSAKVCRSVLSGILGLAVRHGAAATNPVRDVAGITVTPKEIRALTLEEIRAARSAVRSWQLGEPLAEGRPRRGRPPTQDLLDILDLLLATGARIGELLAIRWSDVDLEDGTLTISGTIVSTEDKPARLVRQAHPKSSTSRRRLALPPFAIDALMRRRLAVTVANVHDVVFPSTEGTLRDPGSVRKQLAKVLAPAGLGWVTPHVFRKTVATALDAAEDLRTAADQLGHAGTDVTRRHYVQKTHQGPDARATLEQLVRPAGP